MADADFLKVHWEYDRRRDQELRDEFVDDLKHLSELVDVDIRPPEFTEETAQDLVHVFVDALRRSGNAPLATRWAGAYDNWRQASVRHGEVFSSLQSKSALTEQEAALLTSLSDAVNDAEEHFERVHGEVTAWFGSLDAK
jgi:hypothetical protein